MELQNMASRLNEAASLAEESLEYIRSNTDLDSIQVENSLRQYISQKLLLSEEETSDHIIDMVRINIAKASHKTVEEIKKLDRPGACGSAPAVFSKRVLLYLGIQKALNIKLPPAEMADITTVQELSKIVISLMKAEQ